MKSDRKSRSPINPPEVVLRIPGTEETEDSEDPEKVVTRAEACAREDQKKAAARRSARCIGSKREYADSLHRQADILHHRGDYEAALVLYHRATTAYPRDPRHGVAVRRTSAAISSATNPSGALKKFLSGTKNAAQLAANYCPETAALKARRFLEESPDPVSAIDQILKYFDSRKDFWRDPQTAQDRRRGTPVPRSRTMLRQLSAMASAALENLQAASASGDASSTIRIGEELMAVSGGLPDGDRYQVWARHYLSMAQISLGRHDRAVDQVSMMVAMARKSGDAVLRSRSLATLGRVHLSFGHLEAAARAWEKLVPEVEDAVPKAWLLHEIGRCHLETKRPLRALETARRCLEYADEGNSRKWLLHGKLLSGQALVELGRLGEAVEVLRVAGDAALEEEDSSTVVYIKDLIDGVTGLLRRDVCPDGAAMRDEGVKPEGGGWRAWSKSDDTLREGRSSEWGLCGSSGGAAKSRMVLDSLAGRSQPTKRGRMRSARVRRAQRRGTDIGRIGNSGVRIQPSGSGTFDLRRREEADPAERRIGRCERYGRKTGAPTRRGGDVDRGDLLTSRTRLIGRATPRNKNSGRKSGDRDGEVSQLDAERGDLLTSRTRVIGRAASRNKNSGRKSGDRDGEGSKLDAERGDLLTSGTWVIGEAAPRNKNSGWKSDYPDGEGNNVDEDQVEDSGSEKSDCTKVDELRKCSTIGDQKRVNSGAVEPFQGPAEDSTGSLIGPGDLLTSRTREIGKGAQRDKNSSRKSEDPDGELNRLDEDQLAGEKSYTGVNFVINELRKCSTIINQKRVNSGAVEPFHGPAEVSTGSLIDPGDLLTSRTRVIGKGAQRDKNSSRKSEDPDGALNRLDEDQLAGEKSYTGVNFVVDELRKFSLIMDQNPATWDAQAVELFHDGVEVSGTSAIVRVLASPNCAQYVGDERTEEPEISRSRARPDEGGVEEEVDDEEVGSPSSVVSPASTGKTYLVDEGEKMSPSGRLSRSGDYRETAGNEKKYGSPFDISPGLSRSNDDSKVARNVGATGDSIFGWEMKKRMNVKNLSVRRSIAVLREKDNRSVSPTQSGLLGERRDNDTPGLRAVLEEHLAAGESISTSRSYGLAFSTGRNPRVRGSRSTSPGNKIPFS